MLTTKLLCRTLAALLLFTASLTAADTSPVIVLKFNEDEYKEWERVRTRIEDRCSKSKYWRFARRHETPVEIQTPSERKRLTRKTFSAYKITSKDASILQEFASHFPEVEKVSLDFHSSIKKIPVEVLTALQKLPLLRTVAIQANTNVR